MYETVRETLKKEWSTPPKDLAARFVAAYGALHQGGQAALATPEQEQMRAQQLTAGRQIIVGKRSHISP